MIQALVSSCYQELYVLYGNQLIYIPHTQYNVAEHSCHQQQVIQQKNQFLHTKN